LNHEFTTFLLFSLVGFLAQLVDGALGMAYKVTSNTFILSVGILPSVASASVHVAGMFTSLVSGLSHLKFGNVDKALVLKLVIPGVIGGVSGAYLLAKVLDGEKITPYIAAYLLIMGIVIIAKSNNGSSHHQQFKKRFMIPLGLVGGFLDSIGGGGWGPIVTTTLLSTGHHPRKSIGSVNLAEFFVTVSVSITFLVTLGLMKDWINVAGLMLCGVIAAPIGAMLTRKLPTRWIMIGVGILIVILSIRTLVLAFLK
jgi:uncharacterized membrane protein YfcA